ncbi:MAG: GH1 family beta-glucosidase [Alphaproteobacteria bacterium]|nr:GH1 family beta-glucosidase [Alphaproteobacteria bacterium]
MVGELRSRLPQDFIIGSATAAYQIEGAVAKDGRGPSIWDVFCHTPGAIKDGSTGDVACDHYHRWRDDVALMAELGLDAYRFSLSWSRIHPDGRGAVNPKGLDFYSRLIDGLLDAGITPFVTLYHWDLPKTLQDDGGGWLDPGIIDAFTHYTETVCKHFGDRVKHWTTLNEPWTFCWWGYGLGEDAPGLSLGAKGALLASHHALLAHGAALPIIRAHAKDAEVGIVLDLNCVEPLRDDPNDRAAARRFDGAQNRWYLDALFHGRYPDDMCELFGKIFDQHDITGAKQPLDFLGVNYYRRSVIAAGDDMAPLAVRRIDPPGRYTEMGWEVWPEGLFDLLTWIDRTYRPPCLYVTENGAAFADEPCRDRTEDQERLRYIEAHLEQCARALAAGVPLAGYFVWTLMDNFEWAEGYRPRFGIVHMEVERQIRRIKASGHWLAALQRARRRCP